jgi:transaldolase
MTSTIIAVPRRQAAALMSASVRPAGSRAPTMYDRMPTAPHSAEGHTMTRLRALQEAGVSIWLDYLSRDLLESGHFENLVTEWGVTGATSNPSIFAKAITGSTAYDRQLDALAASGNREPSELFFDLALDDVRAAADLLRPVYEASDGLEGFVSFECTPDLADDTRATVDQALDLWARLDRPNVMIKVPATPAGVPAIEELTARGLNINVTLLFSVDRYEQVMDAYIAGLERRARAGRAVDGITSVASFFVSRIDTVADTFLPADSGLRGRVAIANARRAYRRFRERLHDDRWIALQSAGARPQRLLWASTGAKNPDYSDVLYVEDLVAAGVINTMPEATLRAFADHGDAGRPFDWTDGAADETLRLTRSAGLDLPELTAELERAGVAAFCAAYDELIGSIEAKLRRQASHRGDTVAAPRGNL